MVNGSSLLLIRPDVAEGHQSTTWRGLMHFDTSIFFVIEAGLSYRPIDIRKQDSDKVEKWEEGRLFPTSFHVFHVPKSKLIESGVMCNRI